MRFQAAVLTEKIASKCSDWYYPWTKEQAIQEYNQYEKDMIY